MSVNHRQDPISIDDLALPLDTDHSVIYNPHRTLQRDGSVVEGFKPDEIVDALHLPTGNKEPLVNDVEVRRLTPVERERLMGFPDDWTEGVSDAARNAQTGNAVVVPVVEWIAKRLAAADSLLESPPPPETAVHSAA